MNAEALICDVCETRLSFTWSDQHGVGVCVTCGLPYRIYHYEEHGGTSVRVDKPPTIAIRDAWMPIGKRYWLEMRRRVFPGAFDMGFLGGRSHTYSGATRDDVQAWDSWLKTHEAELPKPEPSA